MHPSLRNSLIERLAEAMRVIGLGGTFERFGQIFMDHYLGIPLSHRGLNVLGNPVGGTIDTKDDMARYAAEYSGEMTYFAGDMAKPTNDLDHVLKLHPGAEHIFLLSSQTAPTGKIEAFAEGKKKDPAFKGKVLHLYDARRIAEQIVDHLLISDTAVDAMAELLPALGQIRDELAASHAVPMPDRRHVARREVEAELDRRLVDQRCVAVWGMGGSGKSNAAAALVAAKSKDFELSLWLKGTEVTTPEDLRAIRLLRGGEHRNLASLLGSRACLAVVDDIGADFPVDRLAALCGAKSRIIVTSRAEIIGGYALPLMTRDEARMLIHQDVPSPCPDGYFEQIWKTVGGHPLSIGLLNKALIEGASWDDVAADCAAVGELEDGDQRLADRILGRIQSTLGRELGVFIWAGQPRIDRRFLERGSGSV